MTAAFETRTCTAGHYPCLSESDSCEPLGSQIWGTRPWDMFLQQLSFKITSIQEVLGVLVSVIHVIRSLSVRAWNFRSSPSSNRQLEFLSSYTSSLRWLRRGCHCTVKEASDHSDLPGEPDLGVITGPRCCYTDERESWVKHRNQSTVRPLNLSQCPEPQYLWHLLCPGEI